MEYPGKPHRLGEAIVAEGGQLLQARGLKLSGGTLDDATLIAAASSTRNAAQRREPEVKQSRKGNPWRFGMKVPVGADSRIGVEHATVVSAAKMHDKHAVPDLLHGEEMRVDGARGYHGCGDRIKHAAPSAKDVTNRRVRQPRGRGRGGAGEAPDQESHPGRVGASVACAEAAARVRPSAVAAGR